MENDDQWVDPLLITDVSWQQKMNNNHPSLAFPSLQISRMADPDEMYSDFTPDVSLRNENQRAINVEDINDPIANDVTNGRSTLRFSLTSPDLVICAESPDFRRRCDVDSTEILKGACSEVSLENGINGSQMEYSVENLAAKHISSLCKTSKEDVYAESSFELLPRPVIDDNHLKAALPVISINSGSADSSVISGGVKFSEDSCFNGGDTTSIGTDVAIGVGEKFSLYRTARLGNFMYYFSTPESGVYVIDLHFAEIVFTEGPPGMRVFDVFIQEEKVISCLDIYARVGAHCPLVIPDLKTFVGGDEGLTIRFEGVIGSPIVCGISIRKNSAEHCGETELIKQMGLSQIPKCKSPKGNEDYKLEENNLNAKKDECQEIELNKWQKNELIKTKRALEVLKRENEQKSKECQEAWNSLQELQNELMRKSMHVGSLAFAVEGQVKEKSRWFSSLRDLTRKLKILKMEQIKVAEEASSYKKCLGDMTEMSSIVLSKLNQQVELHEDLKVKYIKGAKERRELYNKILELKGNIRVFCRCRPLNSDEIDGGASMAIDFGPDAELTVKCNGAVRKLFKFDAVFGPQADQVDVFEETAPFATSVLDGYNVCIFAFGQTGSGKTFTMEGTDEARGVNFRTLEELFRIIEDRNKQFRYEICVSALEVYNEQIRDLLVPGSHSGVAAKRLEIRQVGEGIHHVPGLVEANVKNMSEVWEVLQTGSNARAIGSTNANEHSSRSHCLHCVMVKGENLLNGECTRSKLWLVDLAGSERIAKTEVQGERLKETQNINRSLSALGDVISALATKSPHIPFRNSKLTHLLQDSLGGDSKTLMLVQISPSENDLSETLCSLNFASRVRGIELGPAKKQFDSTELMKYKQLVEKTKQDLKLREVQAKKMEDTIHGLDMKVKDKDLKNKNMQDRIKELESQLLVERKLARQHVDSRIAEQQQQIKQQCEEPNSVLRPVATRPSGIQKNLNEGKDQPHLSRPLTENNSYKFPAAATHLDSFSKCSDFAEKENNPETAELPLPKRTGRASICTMVQRIPASSAPRRNSLIPLPTLPGSAKLAPPVLALTPIHAIDEESKDVIEPKCMSEHENGSKKLASILRRSVQKKMQLKSPRQHIRRGGVNVGMEKIRVSIGSRGRIAHRVLNGNGRRVGKDIQQKQSHREKERGWNTGTAVRAAVI